MAKALGPTIEQEHRMGLHKLAQVRPHLDLHRKLTEYSSK